MTDPTPTRRNELPSLEPWAIELLRQQGLASDASARKELARVVALLRNLPDPGADPARAARVLQAVAERRSRAPVLHALFGAARRVATPPAALALAAAMAGLLAVTVAPGSLSTLLGGGSEPLEIAVTPQPRVVAEAASRPAPRPNPIRRRSTPVIRPHLVNVSLFTPSPTDDPRLRYDRAPFEYAHDRGLDRQLNQLLIDPNAFAERLERVAQRDRFIARLANRAAERGDAPEIALRVRQSQHPLAGQLVESLLHATLVASVSPR